MCLCFFPLTEKWAVEPSPCLLNSTGLWDTWNNNKRILFQYKNCSTRCGNYHDKNRTVAKQHLLYREGFQNKEMILTTLPRVELWDMKGPWTIISHAVISFPCRRYYCRPIISYTSRGNVMKYTWNITAFIRYHFQRMSILLCTSSINVRQNWLR